MKGPIVWRPAAGNSRRTEKPPRSRGRPSITRSMLVMPATDRGSGSNVSSRGSSLQSEYGRALVEHDIDRDVARGEPLEILLQLRADDALAGGQRLDADVIAVAL